MFEDRNSRIIKVVNYLLPITNRSKINDLKILANETLNKIKVTL